MRTEAALRATETRFQAIVQNAPFVTYVKDTEGRYLFYNRESERVFHITGTEFIGKTIRDVYPEAADSALIDDLDRQVVETGEPVVTEVRMPATTELEWALVIKFPIRDEDGRIVGIGGFDLDVAKQKRAELALAQSEAQRQATEQRFARIVDLVQEGIWIHVGGTILFANPAAARLFGAAAAEDLIGTLDILPAAPRGPRTRPRAHARRTATRAAVPLREMRLIGLDGQTRIAELQAVPFEEDGRLHIVSSGRDVTAQREAEARLHQVQKMDAVGQLTGGIAHDFNNLLTVIIGNLDLSRSRLPAEIRPAIEQALRAAERGAALTHRLLAFSRRQTLIAEPLDLNRLAADMEDLLRRTLGEHVEIEMKLPAALWPALADKSQVENALLNLAINARDAMPDGGKLTIETGNMHLDDDYAAHNADVTPGDYVMLAVTDTGVGMPPDVVERAFEPFFTTKGVGKGTGLGLSMIYGFAKQSRGHVKIYSEVGHGTTVRLYLPRPSDIARAEAAAPPSPRIRAAAKRSWWSKTTCRCAPSCWRSCATSATGDRGRRRAGGAADPRERRDDRPAVHRRGDARRPDRPPARRSCEAATAGPEDSLHLRLHRRLRPAPRPDGPRRPPALQALPPARSGHADTRGARRVGGMARMPILDWS